MGSHSVGEAVRLPLLKQLPLALPTCRRPSGGFAQESKWRGFPDEQLA
ncbi:hypothetical protein [Nostoc sp. 106C]|nr:hypothetical protein [Nostoc sp. 106C]